LAFPTSFRRPANAVPREHGSAELFENSDGGITQKLAALATLATLNSGKWRFWSTPFFFGGNEWSGRAS
jgi:hypothetical protein